MLIFNNEQISLILSISFPILSAFFIFIYESLNKRLNELEELLLKEVDKNKGFRHSHYQIDKTVAEYLDSVHNDSETLRKRIRELEIKLK